MSYDIEIKVLKDIVFELQSKYYLDFLNHVTQDNKKVLSDSFGTLYLIIDLMYKEAEVNLLVLLCMFSDNAAIIQRLLNYNVDTEFVYESIISMMEEERMKITDGTI